MIKKKILKLLSISVVLYFLLKQDVCALVDARIVTDFDSEYTVNEENVGEVDMDVTFTNEGEVASILSSYSLNIGNIDPSNVIVSYGSVTIPFTMYESSGMVVQMSLGEIILSPDTPEVINIKYDVSKFFSKIGGAYDVFLSLYDDSTRTNGGSLSLRYPNSFGDINYSSLGYEVEEGEIYSRYSFTSDEIESLYISVGNERNFSFSMERKLENSSDGYVTQEILLPVDSAGQTIILTNISPFPDRVDVTDDGNLFITYNVAPSDTIWVRIQGIIVRKVVEDSSFVLSSGEKSVHLDTSMALWKISDEDIILTISELEEDMSLGEKISWIYEYLTENLNLSDDFRELHSFEYRKGAEIALQTYKNASAEDFADSFVALARILDIPSRIVSGYVFPYSYGSSQTGIYHMWAQYWSEDKEWVSVDPAYELYSGYSQEDSTGLNRVIIAVYPSSLKDIDFEESSSEIFFTDEKIEEEVDLDIEIEISDQIQAGINEVGSITLYNNGNTIIKGISFSDAGSDIEVAFGDQSDRTVLLPGESFDYSFRIKISEWNISGTKTIGIEVLSLTANGEERLSEEKRVNVVPLRWAEPVTWVFTSILFLISTGGLYYGFKFINKNASKILSKFKRK
jgi:hypothetical protein